MSFGKLKKIKGLKIPGFMTVARVNLPHLTEEEKRKLNIGIIRKNNPNMGILNQLNSNGVGIV